MPSMFVDLTLETTDEEEVMVVASNPVGSRNRTVTWEYAQGSSRGQVVPSSSLQSLSARQSPSPAVKLSPDNQDAAYRHVVSGHDLPQTTPSKTARFALLKDAPPQAPASSLPVHPRAQPLRAPSVPPPLLSKPIPRVSTPPPPPPQPATEQRTPRMRTPDAPRWTVDQIANKLAELVGQVRENHGRLVEFMLEEAEMRVPQQKHLSAVDHFADMKSVALDHAAPQAQDPDTEKVTVKFKQHSGEHWKHKGAGKKVVYPVIGIRCDTEPVPKYRFHHVEIRKNILTPNTMLNFVPHLRDVDPNSAEEKKYSNWLSELDKLDTQSGFKTQDRIQKLTKRERDEYAATLSMYLEPWLEALAIDGCTKSTLIRYMASQAEHDHVITPQQKSTILNTYSQDIGSPRTNMAAKLFTEAFDRIFNSEDKHPRVTLRDILLLDKFVETIVDNKRAKDTPSAQRHHEVDLLPQLDRHLGSYSCLGCLICFSHDCEHGEFDPENNKLCLSVDCMGGLIRTLQGKWKAQIDAQGPNGQAAKVVHCKRECYRAYQTGPQFAMIDQWTPNEVNVLKSIFLTMGYSTTMTADCFVAAVLGRHCWDVHRKLIELNLSLPPIEPRTEPSKVKALSWYDRKKKQLIGDWHDCTTTHEHAQREEFGTCFHDGPCTSANGCPCASAFPRPVLCERFCHCTAEECALKFTGCACHSQGKTCMQKQKEGKPCICVQLNRECDPVLCKGCGARERADPENAQDETLHSTGCQNVALQRGAGKVVLLGKSQLEGCGYGLFTAEDVAQDEFLIEYTGELITHDEGVRREARRGDVFDEEHTTSYLFTLLEEGGIWVDAAIYGNLSRYINHASEHDKKGCNITPKIMYVNHEFRIKFTALRDIKAGEELFFNYGDNFPNLTKKLLEQDEEKPGQSSEKRKTGTQRSDAAARKTTKTGGKGKGKKPDVFDEDDPMDWATAGVPFEDDLADDWEEEQHTPKRRKKRGGRRPGAGRKKKVVVADDNNQPREVPDSQDDSSLPPPSVGTDTPMRSGRIRGSSTNPGALATTRSNKPADEPPAKKVSKRGGARPGAGRKPKHPKAAKTNLEGNVSNGGSSASSSFATNNNKSTHATTNNAGEEDGGHSRGLLHDRITPSAASGAAETTSNEPNRKRKANELIDSGEEEIMAGSTSRGGGGGGGPYREDHFQPIDDDDDDDDAVADRPRKRQKPLRYRHEET